MPDAPETLGAALTGIATTPDGEGSVQHFEYGSIYYHPRTGAHEVHGRIRDRYAMLGFEAGPLGYPSSDEYSSGGLAVSEFEHGRLLFRFDAGDAFRVYQQNMGLLPSVDGGWPYLGDNRQASIDALIDYLAQERPEVVALSEVFDDGERRRFFTDPRVQGLYPYTLDAPDEGDFEEDGGLLLMSQLPIEQTHSTIYRDCVGPDCAANKGAIHARVRLPSGASYDIVHTHTQDPDAPNALTAPGPRLRRQLTHLYSFLEACRGPGLYPAFVTGDLNTDAFDSTLYDDMMTRLHEPTDAWLAGGVYPAGAARAGITSDDASDFESKAPRVPGDPYAAPRGISGARIDYLLSYPSMPFAAALGATRQVNVQTRAGRDMSDHYGLLTEVSGTEENHLEYTGDITGVEARLVRVHALEATDGLIALGVADDIEFRISLRVDDGGFVHASTPDLEMETGDVVDLPVGPRVSLPGPVARDITIRIQGWEVDDVWADTNLGVREVTLTRAELVQAMLGELEFGLGPFAADGGQYTVRVRLGAEG